VAKDDRVAKGVARKDTDAKRLKITLVRSPIGFNKTQGETVRGMGLRRIRHTVELADTPETRGMIHKVRHLVEVNE
jgi:large subunit ribosomal protein L30